MVEADLLLINLINILQIKNLIPFMKQSLTIMVKLLVIPLKFMLIKEESKVFIFKFLTINLLLIIILVIQFFLFKLFYHY